MSELGKIALAVVEIVVIAAILALLRARFARANPRLLLISLFLFFIIIDIIIGIVVR